MIHTMSSAFEQPIAVDIYDHPLNSVSINPSLALPGILLEQPALLHEVPEKSLPEITDELYSPTIKPELEPYHALGDTEDKVRTNDELAGLVAEVKQRELEAARQKQIIEKIYITPATTRQIGTAGLKLLEAANSL